MALITETVTINGKEYKHYYSDEGYYIKRNDNKLFMDVLQPSSSTNTYTETTQLATQSLIPRMMNRMSTIETNHNALANLPHIVETYNNGTDWYRVYSDKWLQIGGYTKAGTVITYKKSFANTNYGISMGVCSSYGDSQPTETKIAVKTTTQLKFNQAFNGSTTYNVGSYEWTCFGYTN